MTIEEENIPQMHEDVYAGIHPVLEALKAGIRFDTVYTTTEPGKAGRAVALCAEQGAIIKNVPVIKLNNLCGGSHHQGIVAIASAVPEWDMEDIFRRAEELGQKPLILIAANIEDPHNIGALIRTAECAGAHGLLLPRRRSAVLGGVVAKASAGAVAHLPVVKVANLTSAIELIKKRGVWVYGAEADGVPYNEQDYTSATAIVIGSEGEGIGRLIKEHCDAIVSIPMAGKINSLNASVAGGVLLFEAAAQRRIKKA